MGIVLLLTTLASFAALLVGLMGLLGRLPRNHFAGIRTKATLASDGAWRESHRVGSPALIFAAVAALAMGLAVLPFVLADEIDDGVVIAILITQAVVLVGGAAISWFIANRAARQYAG